VANTTRYPAPMTSHNRDPETTRLYARHKRAIETQRDTIDPIKEAASRELLAGVTTKELAEATGLSIEYFRRLARAVGAERHKPPTVGKDAPKKTQPNS